MHPPRRPRAASVDDYRETFGGVVTVDELHEEMRRQAWSHSESIVKESRKLARMEFHGDARSLIGSHLALREGSATAPQYLSLEGTLDLYERHSGEFLFDLPRNRTIQGILKQCDEAGVQWLYPIDGRELAKIRAYESKLRWPEGKEVLGFENLFSRIELSNLRGSWRQTVKSIQRKGQLWYDTNPVFTNVPTVRRYVCSFCDSTTSNKPSSLGHLSVVHLGLRLLCRACGFLAWDSDHMQRNHPGGICSGSDRPIPNEPKVVWNSPPASNDGPDSTSCCATALRYYFPNRAGGTT